MIVLGKDDMAHAVSWDFNLSTGFADVRLSLPFLHLPGARVEVTTESQASTSTCSEVTTYS
jgi:hypothetical protein